MVTAVNKSDLSSVGSAMALVSQTPAVHGVAVAPRNSLVTPGQSVQLSTNDATGSPVSVNWTLSPNIGQITAGWSEGQYTYTAPATIAGATMVTALAVNSVNRGQTGAANVQVAPSTTVSVQPKQSDATRGATVALTATVTAGDIDDLRWVVYPLGAGTIAPDPADPAKATFTAPASNAKAGQARVVAYLLDDQTAGLGSADIALKV